jgi:ABC-type Fe3+ transport system permease subunit
MHGNAPSAANLRLAGSRSAAALMVAVASPRFSRSGKTRPADLAALLHDSYLWHVVRFSFWQAFLSALLSVAPAIFLARAFYRRRFPGRLALLPVRHDADPPGAGWRYLVF